VLFWLSLPAISQPPQRIRVAPNVQAASLLAKVDPVYPPLARQSGVQGTVRSNAVIGRDGHVAGVELISGDKLLVDAAKQAVMKYVYKPMLIQGQPVKVVTQLDVAFVLGQQGSARPPSAAQPTGAPARQTAPSAVTTTLTLPANADGQTAAQYLWDTILTKCGDSWYYGGSKLELADRTGEHITDGVDPNFGQPFEPTSLMWEYKGVKFEFSSRKVSQAEALNGVTWKGVAGVKMTAWRARDLHGNWSEWKGPQEYANGLNKNKVVVEKINGAWVYISGEFLNPDDANPMTVVAQVSATELAPRNKPSCNASQPR
jgi:protein TonB